MKLLKCLFACFMSILFSALFLSSASAAEIDMRFHRFVTPSLENPTGLIMYWDGLKKPLTPADSCGSRNNRPPSPSCDMPPTKPSPTPDPKPKPKPDPEPDPKPKKKVKKTTKNKFKKNKFKAEDNSNNNVGNNGDVTNNNSN